MSNAFNLQFTEDELTQLFSQVEQETKSAYDALSEGVYRATRDFARSLSPVYDNNGDLIEEESPEWELWVDSLDNLVSFDSCKIKGLSNT